MGHANYLNISKRVNKLLHDGGEKGVSLRDCVDALEKARQKVSASEGALEERTDLSQAVEQVFEYLLRNGAAEPAELTKEQSKVYNEWRANEDRNWDSGSNGEGGQYGIFDHIRWKALKKRLPVLGDVTS